MHDCKAVHPDDFLLDIAVSTPEQLFQAVRSILRRLRDPPVSFDKYVDVLRRLRLPRTAETITARKQDFSQQ